jgi:flavin reductase ActVB
MSGGGAGPLPYDLPSVSAQRFRDALARWPSGVTVVTARDGETPVGMTAASFSSLSLYPPLILVCIDKTANAHDGLVGADGFAIHILGRDQEHLSVLFAQPGAAKFRGFPDERGIHDAPLIPFGPARLSCVHDAALEGGDHTILVGRVVGVELGPEGTEPLIYSERTYHGLD